MAIPTEQITMYFHEASSDERVRRCPTRKVVTIVVASTATHSTPEVGGQHGEEHGGHESLDEDAVERGVPSGAATGGDLDLEVAHAVPSGQHGDHPDDHHHEGTQRVGPQDPGQPGDRPPVHDVDGDHDAGDEHPRCRRRAQPTDSPSPRHEGGDEPAGDR